MKLVLASHSPARALLLRHWRFTFTTRPTNFAEESIKRLISDPKNLVETLATKKYEACPRHHQDEIILAADTIIFFNHQLIGKPTNRADAQSIISTLAGHTHQVWTGVCLNGQVFSDVASVTFKPMTAAQIETFLDTNDWMNKAGAYQIQKSIRPHVAAIYGDINTIIGLPTKTKHKINLYFQSS